MPSRLLLTMLATFALVGALVPAATADRDGPHGPGRSASGQHADRIDVGREPRDPGTTTTSERRAAPAPRRTLTITNQRRGHGTVPRELLGGNLRWPAAADGAWDPRRKRVREDTARQMRRIGLGSIRYPGGTVANLFDHRNAVGTPGCQTSGGFFRPLFSPIPARLSQYTIGRHAVFARKARASTNLMIPMINTTPQRAVDYVRAVARATGQRRFVVDIGNEPFLRNQRYWRSTTMRQRLDDYILGGHRKPTGSKGDDRLYAVSGCDLRTPAAGTGTRNQAFRPRYTPISTTTTPRVWVGGREWTYVPDITRAGLLQRAFSVDATRERIVFGNGLVGAVPPRGASLRISYTAGMMPGFRGLYSALSSMSGVDVKVCSSWATDGFVQRMARLGLPYDCLSPHTYPRIKRPADTRRGFAALMREARAENVKLGRLRNLMHAAPGAGARDRFLTVTEYGGPIGGRNGSNPTFMRDLVKAVAIVGQVHQGVRLANLANFGSLLNHFRGRVSLSGQGYLLGMARHLVGKQAVDVNGAPGDLPVAATRDGKRTAMLVVNTSWSRDRRVAIDLQGRAGATCVGVRSLRTEPTDHTRPRSAKARPRSVQKPRRLTWTGGTLTQTFRSHSITLLTFQAKGRGACPKVGPL